MKNRFLTFLLIIAIVLLISAFWYGLKHRVPIGQAEAQRDKPKPKIINIPKQQYTKANWDSYGPDYNNLPDGRITQYYMSRIGSITYTVPIGQTLLTGNEVEVSSRMSSELKKAISLDATFSSDVTLLINGVEQQTLNVVPDDEVGMFQTWKVPTKAFKPNADNEITFAVKKDSFYKNGLCIYTSIELKFLGEQ